MCRCSVTRIANQGVSQGLVASVNSQRACKTPRALKKFLKQAGLQKLDTANTLTRKKQNKRHWCQQWKAMGDAEGNRIDTKANLLIQQEGVSVTLLGHNLAQK